MKVDLLRFGLTQLCPKDSDRSCLHCCHEELLYFLLNDAFDRSHDAMAEFLLPEVLVFSFLQTRAKS